LLRGQLELEPVDQEFELGLGVSGEHDLAAVGGRQMDIDHLDGSELFERASGGQAGCEGVQAAGQGDMQAVGEEGDEDVGFDPLFVLVEDRSNGEVALEVPERLFDGDELDVVLPEQGGIVVGEIWCAADSVPRGVARFAASCGRGRR
jgi:hypothetical protein